MAQCVRCSLSHSNPNSFLVACARCRRSWHHTCHLPPVSDQELISRIHAFTAGDRDNDIHAWKCRRCLKAVQPRPILAADANPMTTLHVTLWAKYNLAPSWGTHDDRSRDLCPSVPQDEKAVRRKRKFIVPGSSRVSPPAQIFNFAFAAWATEKEAGMQSTLA